MSDGVTEQGQIDRQAVLAPARKVVVKVGSAVLTDAGGLDRGVMARLCAQIAALKREGREITLVSSGAIAAGQKKLAHLPPARTVPEKQAFAAVGQGRLMQAYEELFDRYGIHVAQILVTRDGLVPRRRYVNTRNTLRTLLQWGIVPVVNENDTVATEELQFTDNDALAAMMVNLVEADLLICLSDIDGLYGRDPREDPLARRVSVVTSIDEETMAMAGAEPGRAGRGGMRSKLEAARMAAACGVPMIVAGGRVPDVLTRLFSGEDLGTLFLAPKGRRLYGRKPWIALTLARQGVLILDAGAVEALLRHGKSLLPVGVRAVEGSFEAGACVVCRAPSGEEMAVGLSSYSAEDLRKICGCQTGDICARIGHEGVAEVIHRDNLVVL